MIDVVSDNAIQELTQQQIIPLNNRNKFW